MAGNKLTAKASKLDFSRLPGSVPVMVPDPGVALPARAPRLPDDAAQRPKTAPGAMMAFANDARSELLRENEDLRGRAAQADALRGRLDEALGDLAQWDGAKATRLLDAGLIVPSRFANRHVRHFDTPEFLQLKQEIESAGGNVQPVKVRPLSGGAADGPRYELVYGHRRHRACLDLGLPVLAVVDNLDDRALFVEMERENRSRKDLSAWEQGMMYRRALQQGLFPSNRKLSEAIGVDLSALGKALALAELPQELVDAFPTPLALQFRWAKPLNDAVARDKALVMSRARALAGRRGEVGARQVFETLVAAQAVSVAGVGEGVERFHSPAPAVDIQVDGVRRGKVVMEPSGRVIASLDGGVLSPEHLPALAAAMAAFVAAASSEA